MHEELYGGSRPDFVRKMGNEVSFPENLNSEQEMAGVISKVLEALDTSDIQPTKEAEMKRLAAVCQSWGYGAVCRGTSEQVAAILGKKIWARGARRIKPPPFGPFGPESVQKARSCQMERKSQFLTADTRGDSQVLSHVVAKATDGGWWFAGVAITQADAPAAEAPYSPVDTGCRRLKHEEFGSGSDINPRPSYPDDMVRKVVQQLQAKGLTRQQAERAMELRAISIGMPNPVCHKPTGAFEARPAPTCPVLDFVLLTPCGVQDAAWRAEYEQVLAAMLSDKRLAWDPAATEVIVHAFPFSRKCIAGGYMDELVTNQLKVLAMLGGDLKSKHSGDYWSTDRLRRDLTVECWAHPSGLQCCLAYKSAEPRPAAAGDKASSAAASATTVPKSTPSGTPSSALGAPKAGASKTSAQVGHKGDAIPSAKKMREPDFDGNALLIAEKQRKAQRKWWEFWK